MISRKTSSPTCRTEPLQFEPNHCVYLALDDPDWKDGQTPLEIGSAQFGRISDSEAIALMDAASDAAWRAVEEQTADN